MPSPPGDRDRALVLDIVLSARDALSFVDGLDAPEFADSRLHQNAVIRCLEIIGEAAGSLSIRALACRWCRQPTRSPGSKPARTPADRRGRRAHSRRQRPSGHPIRSARTWAELRASFDKKPCVSVVFAAGQYPLVSMVLNTFGAQIEPWWHPTRT
jgi:hypothetical protein